MYLGLQNWTSPDIIAASAAVVALGISLWAAQKAHKTTEVQTTIQAKMLEIEQAREADRQRNAHRAELSAAFQNVGQQLVLRVTNRGNSHAVSPNIFIDGEDILASVWNVYGFQPPAFVGSQGCYDFPLISYDNMQRHFDIQLHWHNQDGSAAEWKSSVSLTL